MQGRCFVHGLVLVLCVLIRMLHLSFVISTQKQAAHCITVATELSSYRQSLQTTGHCRQARESIQDAPAGPWLCWRDVGRS